MSYRATPLPWCSISPAELLMGRRIRTTVPQTKQQLTPQWQYLGEFQRLNKLYKGKQKEDFDRGHRVKELPELPDDSDVWITGDTEPIPGRIVTPAETPRSYIVETPTGEVRRNRSQLRAVPENEQGNAQAQPTIPTPTEPGTPMPTQQSTPVAQSTPRVIMTRSRTGTEIRPPDRL